LISAATCLGISIAGFFILAEGKIVNAAASKVDVVYVANGAIRK
jgi:hypothetical protein